MTIARPDVMLRELVPRIAESSLGIAVESRYRIDSVVNENGARLKIMKCHDRQIIQI